MANAGIVNSFKSKIVQGVAGAFGLRLVYTGLTFLTSILIARVLGTVGLGTYNYAIVWAYLLSVPATLGLDNFVVREIAVYRTKSSWGFMRGLLQWADRAVILVSVSLAVVAILVALAVDGGDRSGTFTSVCIAISLMPALSLRNVRRGAMRGLHHVTLGLLPELLIDPLILITLTISAYFLLGSDFAVYWIVVFYGTGTVITLVILNQMLSRSLPNQAKTASPEYKTKFWLSGALPFVLIESIPIVNSQTDVIMLGAFRGTEAVGLYVPVNRGAQLITFILMAMSSTLAPTIASAYADGQLDKLQRTITKGVRVVAGVALLFATSLIIFGQWYLKLFGAEFVAGSTALYILCTGTFISTSVGLSMVILNMTGHERYAANVGWIITVLNVVLNAIFIPRWSVNGAALATSLSIILGGVISLIAVRQKLGIDATIFGIFSSDRPR